MRLTCIPIFALAILAQGSPPAIRRIDPPEQGFFSKELDYDGIAIKSHAVVADAALFAARDKIATELAHLPNARLNMAAVGAELHIIGKDQVTSDLPEFRDLKGKPFDGKLTVDERTRGLGGLLTSCGEENLLHLPGDRYAGSDICIHEFAHNIQNMGFDDAARARITEQYHKSLAAGLWNKAYAATNDSEYFAELSMWYFGTHGNLGMTGVKPANGPGGLRAYDPDAYKLIDDLYSGRIPIAKLATEELTPYPVDREKDLKSSYLDQKTTIEFFNHTATAMKLYWLDDKGQRRPMGQLKPGEPNVRQTFVGHVWLVADQNGTATALYVAGKKWGLATPQ